MSQPALEDVAVFGFIKRKVMERNMRLLREFQAQLERAVKLYPVTSKLGHRAVVESLQGEAEYAPLVDLLSAFENDMNLTLFPAVYTSPPMALLSALMEKDLKDRGLSHQLSCGFLLRDIYAKHGDSTVAAAQDFLKFCEQHWNPYLEDDDLMLDAASTFLSKLAAIAAPPKDESDSSPPSASESKMLEKRILEMLTAQFSDNRIPNGARDAWSLGYVGGVCQAAMQYFDFAQNEKDGVLDDMHAYVLPTIVFIRLFGEQEGPRLFAELMRAQKANDPEVMAGMLAGGNEAYESIDLADDKDDPLPLFEWDSHCEKLGLYN